MSIACASCIVRYPVIRGAIQRYNASRLPTTPSNNFMENLMLPYNSIRRAQRGPQMTETTRLEKGWSSHLGSSEMGGSSGATSLSRKNNFTFFCTANLWTLQVFLLRRQRKNFVRLSQATEPSLRGTLQTGIPHEEKRVASCPVTTSIHLSKDDRDWLEGGESGERG